MARRLPIALAVTIAFSATASAHAWQYCLAPSFADHRLYVSTSFRARNPLRDADRAYAQVLTRARQHYSDIQCPAAEGRRRIADMRRHALHVNRALGMAIVPLPLDTPSPTRSQVSSLSAVSRNN